MANTGGKYLRFDEGRIGLRRFREGVNDAPRVIGFPYAGGQSLAFRELAGELPQEWGMWAIDPPGHGWTPGPALETIPDMVDAYLLHIPQELLDGAVLVGHSLGGCVAFALTQQLQEHGRATRAVVLSAARPPHRKDEYESFLTMTDERLLECLIQIGGVPTQWAAEPEIFDHFKGALRADFRAFEAFEIDRPLEGVPAMAFGGMQDVVCRPQHVFEWSRYCPGCRVDFVGGDHLYLQSQADQLAPRIAAFLNELPASDAKYGGG